MFLSILTHNLIFLYFYIFTNQEMYRSYSSPTYAPQMNVNNAKKLIVKLITFFILWHIVIYTYTKFVGYSNNDNFYKYQVWVMTQGQGVLIICLASLFVLLNYQRIVKA